MGFKKRSGSTSTSTPTSTPSPFKLTDVKSGHPRVYWDASLYPRTAVTAEFQERTYTAPWEDGVMFLQTTSMDPKLKMTYAKGTADHEVPVSLTDFFDPYGDEDRVTEYFNPRTSCGYFLAFLFAYTFQYVVDAAKWLWDTAKHCVTTTRNAVCTAWMKVKTTLSMVAQPFVKALRWGPRTHSLLTNRLLVLGGASLAVWWAGAPLLTGAACVAATYVAYLLALFILNDVYPVARSIYSEVMFLMFRVEINADFPPRAWKPTPLFFLRWLKAKLCRPL